MQKIGSAFYDYSNAFLIFLTIILLLILMNYTSQINREGANRLIQVIKVYSHAFEFHEDGSLHMDPVRIKNTLDAFDGLYSGESGNDLNQHLRSLYQLLDDYSPLNSPDKNRALILTCGEELLDFTKAYEQILNNRGHAVQILFQALIFGFLIQSMFLFLSLKQKRKTEKQFRISKLVLGQVQKAREQERRSIASFLHDSILQDLGGLLLTPEVTQSEQFQTTLQTMVTRLRNLTYTIAPVQLKELGLKESLIDLADTFRESTGVHVDMSISGVCDSYLNEDSMLIFYRIVQEGLNNIEKHAQAEHVRIRLTFSHPYLILTIKDDGCGMIQDRDLDLEDERKHLGLLLMQQQVESIGAEMALQSDAERGTILKVKYNCV